METIMKIGDRIKTLRKANDMTQEKLANYLGVSFQAISKWECGTASPDISLLVPISRLFEVTIDELFDNTRQNTDSRREELQKAYDETFQSGDTEKRYMIAKSAAEEYPGDLELLEMLASAEWSYGMHEMATKPEKRKEIWESSVKHAELVIENIVVENAVDNELKNNALRTITFSLHDLGRWNEALVYARMSDDEELITMCLTGEERVKRKQEKINRVLANLVGTLSVPDNRIEELDAADALIKVLIPDGNYLFYTGELMHNDIWRAGYYAANGLYEKAITALKQAYKYAVEYDEICSRDHAAKYTCPILDHIEFDAKSLIKSGMSTLCEDFAEYLSWTWFDSMRDMDEFKALYRAKQ